jgi:hypothetical protein
VTDQPRWRDAEMMAERFTDGDWRALLLLVRLPLLWEFAIEQLYGLRGDTSVYRSLARLRAAGLIDELRPALRAGRNPSLFYLTDLGLATISVRHQIDPVDLARQAGLRGPDLRRRLLRLPHLLALYQMLAALASARPGRIDLLAWEQPWRRAFHRPMRKTPITVEMPARAAMSWDDEAVECLLLPDLATIPLRAYHPALGELAALRSLVGDTFPAVLVATTDARQAAWLRLLDEAARSRHAAPLPAHVVTWRELSDDAPVLDGVVAGTRPLTTVTVRRLRVRPLDPRRPTSPIPRLVGVVNRSDSTISRNLGILALQVSPMERELLDIIARHPFLSTWSLAVVLGWQVRRLRERRVRLIELGLARQLDASERSHEPLEDRTELTQSGLKFVAAQQGLSLARAVRVNGLAGGGPEYPTGTRRLLLRDLEHTLGTDDLFVGLYRQFAPTATAKAGNAVLEWLNAAACSRRRVRPDGYGMLQCSGGACGFFLEYDRGTMSTRDYAAKWNGYYHYLESHAYERDYHGFPTILVVTTDRTAEERIARSVRAASVGRWLHLPVLLTCQWRIDRDPSNPDGLLGAIWLDPRDGPGGRRAWPTD